MTTAAPCSRPRNRTARWSSTAAGCGSATKLQPNGAWFMPADSRAAGPSSAAGDSDALRAARAQLVSYSARLLADGLAIGSAGNISVRSGDTVAITPSGVSYAEMRPEDICLVATDGTELGSSETPSSETPMHLAIYAATNAAAVVHTHSPEVIALSASRP